MLTLHLNFISIIGLAASAYRMEIWEVFIWRSSRVRSYKVCCMNADRFGRMHRTDVTNYEGGFFRLMNLTGGLWVMNCTNRERGMEAYIVRVGFFTGASMMSLPARVLLPSTSLRILNAITNC